MTILKIRIKTETKKKIIELLKVKKKYELLDIEANTLISELIIHEIQRVKDKKPTLNDIKERNLKRIIDLKENRSIYCPIIGEYTDDLDRCLLSCIFGHITECHYPYDCRSEFCEHSKLGLSNTK